MNVSGIYEQIAYSTIFYLKLTDTDIPAQLSFEKECMW